MSKSNITFTTDRKSATEGELVTVSWDCGVPDSVTLRVDNGYRTYILQLPDSGSRAIMVEKCKGKMSLRLSAACGTRVERREIDVKVKNIKITKTTTARPRNAKKFSLGSPKELWQRAKSSIRSFIQRVEYAWRVMPPKTKRIYKFLLILLAVMWISSLGQSRGYRAGYEQALKDQQSIEQRYHNGFEQPTATDNNNNSI